jgi:predicted DNA-binding protein (MmcQ/YjbR family)
MTDPFHDKIRAICLDLPEAEERLTWGEPNFRVRDKIFALYHASETGGNAVCKAPPGAQSILVGADGARFYVPAYVGHKGWVGIRLDAGTDWAEVAQLLTRSYRLVAPKRLAARI